MARFNSETKVPRLTHTWFVSYTDHEGQADDFTISVDPGTDQDDVLRMAQARLDTDGTVGTVDYVMALSAMIQFAG